MSLNKKNYQYNALTLNKKIFSKLNVNTQYDINFAKTFDVADEPITEGIEFQIEAESPDADKIQLQQIIRLAEDRCPAVYSMKHEIKVNSTIK